MARIRTLKPEFFQNEDLADCSAHARLLAIALLQLADSEGRFRWIPMQVHAHTFPFESDLNIESLALELEQAGYFSRYEVDGRQFAEIPNFLKHQRLTGKEAQVKSKIPPREAKGKQQDFLGEAPGCPGTGEQGNREQGTGEQDVCTEQSCSASPSAVIITLTLNTGDEHPITESQLKEFSELYPAVDVMQELRSMRGWCINNPKKRKTKSGISRFINSWLSREQDRGPSSGNQRQKSRAEQHSDKLREIASRSATSS